MDLSLFNFKVEKNIKSERAEVVKSFLDEINLEREGTKYNKLTAKAIACKLGHIKELGDLYYFLSECKDYKKRNGSFSKYFFGALKVKSTSYPQFNKQSNNETRNEVV